MRPTTQQPATTCYTHISRERPPRLLRHLLPLGPLGHTQHLLQLLLLVRRVCRYLRCDYIKLTTEKTQPRPNSQYSDGGHFICHHATGYRLVSNLEIVDHQRLMNVPALSGECSAPCPAPTISLHSVSWHQDNFLEDIQLLKIQHTHAVLEYDLQS